MITIAQLLESVDLYFEPRWVTKDENGEVCIFEHKPKTYESTREWLATVPTCGISSFDKIKIAEFENKPWTECIYEVPRKTTWKIEKFVIENDRCGNVEWWDVVKKINQIVDYVNALIESNNIHEKQIDKLQMKLEPEKCAVNELKGAKNE